MSSNFAPVCKLLLENTGCQTLESLNAPRTSDLPCACYYLFYRFRRFGLLSCSGNSNPRDGFQASISNPRSGFQRSHIANPCKTRKPKTAVGWNPPLSASFFEINGLVRDRPALRVPHAPGRSLSDISYSSTP